MRLEVFSPEDLQVAPPQDEPIHDRVSQFFQQVFQVGVQLLVPKSRVLISNRQGPLRYQTAAYGALLNAMRPEDPHAAARLCPSRRISRPDAATCNQLRYWLRAFGL